jgi:hypothetical protein
MLLNPQNENDQLIDFENTLVGTVCHLILSVVSGIFLVVGAYCIYKKQKR